MKFEIAEKDIQKAILQYLKMRGYLCRRVNAGHVPLMGKNGKQRYVNLGEAGWPDIEGLTKAENACGSGKFFGIEVKARRGIVSPEQLRIGQEIIKNGGIWFVARTVDEVISQGF